LLDAHGGQSFDALCSALTVAGFKSTDVFTIAVATLRAQGRTTSEIVQIIVGAVDPEKGATTAQLSNSENLTLQLLSEAVTLPEIGDAFQSAGLSFEEIAEVLNKAGVIVPEAFTALMLVAEGRDAAEVCFFMLAGGYKADEVYTITVTTLMNEGKDITGIIDMIVGAVLAEEGVSTEQKNSAKYLVPVFECQRVYFGCDL
jgi:hypothetical protein